jgi:MOSC domain-containing protein YiiM
MSYTGRGAWKESNLMLDLFERPGGLEDQETPGTGAVVVSVNVGHVRTVTWRNRQISTGIWKMPVSGRVAVRGVNFDGDDQADRDVHGGPDKAVYAYAHEDLAWWSAELDRLIEPGTFGENLTTRGIDVTNAVIGERWAIGSAVLEVSQPRMPCFKLGIRMGSVNFPRRFATAGRPGAYLRIIAEGEIGMGDDITVLSRPDHGLTVGNVERAYYSDRSLVSRFLNAPELPDPWIK